MTRVQGLKRIDLNSADPDRLAAFYETLGFTRSQPLRTNGETRLELQLGVERVDLVKPPSVGAPYPADIPGWNLLFHHFAIVVSNMRHAYDRLQTQRGWTAISMGGPVVLPETSGGVTAFKFRDPEGHPLELIEFPTRGTSAAELFLGIDHSAISVANTQRSIQFYEAVGIVRSGGSLNTGPEQAALDGIAAPVVEVTALSPLVATPHLELLCYRGSFTRVTSRPEPCDIAATRLIFTEATTGAVVRDPDGHLIVLSETSAYSGST